MCCVDDGLCGRRSRNFGRGCIGLHLGAQVSVYGVETAAQPDTASAAGGDFAALLSTQSTEGAPLRESNGQVFSPAHCHIQGMLHRMVPSPPAAWGTPHGSGRAQMHLQHIPVDGPWAACDQRLQQAAALPALCQQTSSPLCRAAQAAGARAGVAQAPGVRGAGLRRQAGDGHQQQKGGGARCAGHRAARRQAGGP
jgi:hypothetical protein